MISPQCFHCGLSTNYITVLVFLLLFEPNLFAGWTRGAVMQYNDWWIKLHQLKSHK